MICIPCTGDANERYAVSLRDDGSVSVSCQYRPEAYNCRRPSDPEWKTWQDSGITVDRPEGLALRDALTTLLEPEEKDHP